MSSIWARGASPQPSLRFTLSMKPLERDHAPFMVRRSISTRTPMGTLNEQVDYADYRDVAGVKMPFEIRRTNWNTLDTLKIADVKPNAQVDDARFQKPK